MQLHLSPIEVRVLGSLAEKEVTTPEYYPLTLNALTNACNQKNNRDPVVAFEETTVVRALETLREKKLVFVVSGAGMRVPKYKHNLVEALHLSAAELSVLCVLMLRGAQTVGELRSHAAPMHVFASLTEVQTVLDGLMLNEARMPIVRKLSRQAGQKEIRFSHLLSGETAVERPEDTTRPERAVLQVVSENERISRLEEEVQSLRRSISSLESKLSEFRKQFE